MTSFTEHIKPFIDDMEAFTSSLNVHKPRAFRMNGCRGVDYAAELDELFRFTPSGVDSAFFVQDGSCRLADTISFQTGGIYILNPSSVLPAKILSNLMPENPVILDVAASPGGKTCALSDFTRRKGIIVANEPSKSRLKALNFNLERCGAWNVKTLNADGRILHKFYGGTFDGILLDAPCSHENRIGLNKKVQQQWSLKLVSEMASLQKQLMLSAFDCLKPGGALVYSTCTFSPQENEEVIAHLLKERDAQMISLAHPYSIGISGDENIDGHVLRVFPHKTDMDGFFVAAVRKKGESAPFPPVKSKHKGGFINVYFDEFSEDCLLKQIKGDIYLESSVDIRGDFYRTGMLMAKEQKRDILLTAQAVWEFGGAIKAEYRVPLDYKNSLDYLKGFDTPLTSEYSGNIFYYKNIPVGIGKIVGNTYKNKLDRYFLYGKNIEW